MIELAGPLDDGLIFAARPPYGLDTRAFETFAREDGLTPYLWDIDTSDLNAGAPVSEGDIVLLHFRQADEDALLRLLENPRIDFRLIDS